jgi:hypothetical protein
MDNVYDYIAYELLSPNTAVKYFNGILDTIDKLKSIGGSLALSRQSYLQFLYGSGVRTIVYKNMVVVYKVVANYVVIIRVMPGALIK